MKNLSYLLFILILTMSFVVTAAKHPLPPSGLAGSANSAKLQNSQKNNVATTKKKLIGKVVEVVNKDDYCYFLLKDANDKLIWVAILHNKVTVGQMVKAKVHIAYKNFHSKILNKTFAHISFATLEK